MNAVFLSAVLFFSSSFCLAQVESSGDPDESQIVENPESTPADLNSQGQVEEEFVQRITDPILVLNAGQFLGRTSIESGVGKLSWTSGGTPAEYKSSRTAFSQELLFALTDIFLLGFTLPYYSDFSSQLTTPSLASETDFGDNFFDTSVLLGARLPVTNKGKLALEVEIAQKDWSKSESDFVAVELAGSYSYFRNFQLYFSAEFTTFGDSIDLRPYDSFRYQTSTQFLLDPALFVQPEVTFIFRGDQNYKLSALSFERVAYTSVGLTFGGHILESRLSWFANYSHVMGTVGITGSTTTNTGNYRENGFSAGLNYLF